MTSGGGGGIRTPVPVKATGFQDRASMTTFATPPRSQGIRTRSVVSEANKHRAHEGYRFNDRLTITASDPSVNYIIHHLR